VDAAHLERIALDAIAPDPNQPRNLPVSLDVLIQEAQAGDPRAKVTWDKLLNLATSILEVGLQQPITVYPAERDGRYVIYDGHRRWLALSLLHRQGQLDDQLVPCFVRSDPESEDEALLSRLNVNIQREDFNVFELAKSLKQVHASLQANGGDVRLVREDGSVETIAVEAGAPSDAIWDVVECKIGIGRSRRYQIQAVLKLPSKIQRIAEQAGIPESKLRYLIPIQDEGILEQLVEEIVEQELSNFEIRKRIKELKRELVGASALAMPKPVQIRSGIRPIKRLAREITMVSNIPAAISAKDPRTVEGYRELIPELRTTIQDLQAILDELTFLEAE